MSKFIPNSFQTPNWYVDRYMGLLTPEEWVTLAYAIRRIYGFQKESDRISISQFTDGTKDKDGNPLDLGTGLSANTCRQCLKNLSAYGLMVQVSKNTSREGNEWALQLDSDQVNESLIWESYHDREMKNGRRTASATAVKLLLKKQEAESLASTPTTAQYPLRPTEPVPLTCDVTSTPYVTRNPQYTDGNQVGKQVLVSEMKDISLTGANGENPAESENEANHVNSGNSPEAVDTMNHNYANGEGGKKNGLANPLSAHPAIVAMREANGRYPGKNLYGWVIAQLGESPNQEVLSYVCKAWEAKGFKPVNYEGKLAWYRAALAHVAKGLNLETWQPTPLAPNGRPPLPAHAPDRNAGRTLEGAQALKPITPGGIFY